MKAQSPLLSVLVTQALEIAEDYVVGDLEPRLIPSGDGLPLHIMTVGELHGGSVQPTRRPCLLVDVGLPGEYVRCAVHQAEQGDLYLAAPELWPYQALPESPLEPLPTDYVSLFDQLRADLQAELPV